MTDDHQTDIDAAFFRLRATKDRIMAELAGYPTPVSSCDAQFNRLLSDRTRILRALQALSDAPFVATPRQPEPGRGLQTR